MSLVNNVDNEKKEHGSGLIKFLKYSIFILVLIFSLFISIRYGLFYFDYKDLIKNKDSISNDINTLKNMKDELDNLNAKDKEIIEKDLKFNNRTFKKDVLDVKILGLSIIEKSGKKSEDFSLVKLNLDVIANKEKDFKKFLLLLSLNKNIFKIEKISKDNGDKITINLTYKLENYKK